LDLGCGSGALLKRMKDEKNVTPLGLEISINKVQECVINKVPVLQMNIDNGLKAFEDDQFDLAILKFTLQEVREPLLVFKEMLRVSHSCIIAFSNFAHWKVRYNITFHGKVPITEQLPHEWYNTPNIHFLSIQDIQNMCKKEGVKILNQNFYGDSAFDQLLINMGLNNLGASTCLMHISR
jgi:methionine biosynthesis protein MetW